MITNVVIPETMKAVVLERPQTLAYKDIPVWDIDSYGDPDMVLLKVAACGVCGSDLRYYAGENPWAQHTLGRHVDNPPNIVMGHEFAGEVVAVASERNAHLLGKRMAPVCSKTCGTCPECRSGKTQLCPNTVHLGHGQGWGKQDYFPGAYAEYVPAWAASCYEIPEHISYAEAAMMDILAVCVHVAQNGRIEPGLPALILGAGPAGNGIAQAVKYLGANKVVITDRADVALDQARAESVDEVVDVRGLSGSELKDALRKFAPNGYGSIYDSIGSEDSFNLGLDLLGKSGTLVNMAVHDEEIPVNFMKLGAERKITTSSNFATGDYPWALSWLADGRLVVRNWLTSVKLNEIPGIFKELMISSEARSAFKLVITFEE